MLIFYNQLNNHLHQCPRGILLCGDDQPLIDDAIHQVKLCSKSDNHVIRKISLENKDDVDNIKNLGRQNSLFASPIFYIFLCKNWRLINQKLPELLAQLTLAPNYAIFCGPGITKAQSTAKWVKAIETNYLIVRITTLRLQDIPPWTQQKAKQYGVTVNSDICQFIIEHNCHNLTEIDATIRRLANLFSDTPPTLTQIKSVIGNNVSASPWEVSNALLNRKLSELTRIIHQCLISKDHLALIAALSRELERILSVLHAKNKGNNPGPYLKNIGVWPTAQAGYINIARHTTPEAIAHSLVQLAQAEIKFKNGKHEQSGTLIQAAVISALQICHSS